MAVSQEVKSSKGVSRRNRDYKETGWETLEVRRSKHKLCLFYKMSNNISPEYLSSLVPQPIENTTHYGLRDASNIRPPLARTQLYYKSFLPSTIRLWNDLSPETTYSYEFQVSNE